MKKSISFVLLLLAAFGVLTGCANKANDWLKHAEYSASEERIQIEFWHSMASSNGVLLQKLTDAFNQSQDKIYVKAVHQGSYADANTKYQAALSAGEAPVVAQMEIGNIGIFAEAGKLYPLQDFITEENYPMHDFTEGLLDASYYEGDLIALPHSRSLPVLYYNKALFEKYGLDPEKPPEDWEELTQYAKTLTRGDVHGYSCPLDPWYYNALMMCSGGSIFDNELHSIGFDNESGTSPLYLWKTMVRKGTMYVPSGQDYNSSEACRNLFAEEAAAMIMQSSAQLKGLEQTCEFEVGVAPIPIHTNRTYPAGGSNLVMFQGHTEEKQKAGWEFIKFMVQTEQAIAWANGTGYLPIRQSCLESPLFQQEIKDDENLQIIIENIRYCSLIPFYPEYAETMEIISDEIQRCILEENYMPEDAIQSIAADVENLLSNYRRK